MITIDTRLPVRPSTHPTTTGPLLDEQAAEELAATFAVLGDPTRVRLVDALAHGELCVSDLSAVVGLSESAVSHQLRLLRSRASSVPGAPAARSTTSSTTRTSAPCSTRAGATSKRRGHDPRVDGAVVEWSRT